MKANKVALKNSGGSFGLRDQNLLESAVMQPKNVYFYQESVTLIELAANYAYHICRNHAFVDGNKRTAFLATEAFLKANGYKYKSCLDTNKSSNVFEGIANGLTSKEDLKKWLSENITKL
ncbi:type II toxin-antitoxin system death-on-curing family toxin [Fuchsiella alkaliacetigena]|nr:type II toxin-antitoxin system death-on-curing family toxin [Fuchsiella alkaliacetigena]